ncbi:hypothetical protein FBUS_06274 [Fasciolopsis buskii]|uniref:Uncharacterized protein n=1 Tax=Fasciolopsis buskii TaxID=27845 RepID=A0A8E0RKT7_9TREM|nr:hypothetical protein FBUS_06274 [Fasciolopsis buski]
MEPQRDYTRPKYVRNPGEFGLIFEIADAKPLAGNELGSVAYFPAKVREQVEQIFRNLDVIQLSRCVSMWNVWTQCTFERIEPDDGDLRDNDKEDDDGEEDNYDSDDDDDNHDEDNDAFGDFRDDDDDDDDDGDDDDDYENDDFIDEFNSKEIDRICYCTLRFTHNIKILRISTRMRRGCEKNQDLVSLMSRTVNLFQ